MGRETGEGWARGLYRVCTGSQMGTRARALCTERYSQACAEWGADTVGQRGRDGEGSEMKPRISGGR